MSLFRPPTRRFTLELSREDALGRLRAEAQRLREAFPVRWLFTLRREPPVLLVPYDDGADLIHLALNKNFFAWLRVRVEARTSASCTVTVSDHPRQRPESVLWIILPVFLLVGLLPLLLPPGPKPPPPFFPFFPLPLALVFLFAFRWEMRRQERRLMEALHRALPGLREQAPY